jgi:O-antigen/teichoic acid export membrane protein
MSEGPRITYPTKSQTARNVIAIWVNRVLAIVAPLVITPIVLGRLGLETTGVWLLASQLASHLMLLDIGLGTSLMRLLARSKALGDDKLASRYVSTAFYSLAVCSLILLAASPWIGAAFVRWFGIEGSLADTARTLGIVTVVYVAVSLPLRIGYGLVSSSHRFDRIQLWDAIGIGFRVAIIVGVFTLAEPTVLTLALVVFATSIFTAVATLADGRRMNPGWSLAPGNVSKEALGLLSSMSGASLLVTAATVLLMQGSSVVTGSTLGPSAVPLIAYPLMIFTALTPFFNTFAVLASPVAAGLAAQNEQQRMLPAVLTVAQYLTSATVALLIFVLTMGEVLLQLWLPESQVDASDIQVMARALTIILAGFAVSGLSPLARSILSSVGYHWPAAMVEGVTSIAGLVFGFVLMRWTHFDVVGMALGIGTAMCCRALLWPALLARYFQTPATRIISKSLWRPALTAMIAAAAGLIMHSIVDTAGTANPVAPILLLVASGGAWAASTWFLVVLPEHRVLVVSYMARRLGRA